MTTTEIRTDDPTNTTLDNGWAVLAYTEQYQAGEGWRRSGIAILYRGGGYQPFTTHQLIQDEQGRWFAESGTYHDTIDQDLLDTYTERVNR